MLGSPAEHKSMHREVKSVNSVLDACIPRPEILAGTFNPEVFTASLSPIIDYYQGRQTVIDSIYTDAELFFQEATYPTQGLCTTLAEVFGRIAGDVTVPAIHRLETAFGGGKTHTLIACTHIGYRGKELSHVTGDIINPKLLPNPGSVAVVGVVGDEIPVHRPQGVELVPYTLWGEIAYQIGGEELYRQVESEVTSHAAPGRTYFDRVFSDRKVLVMLDELAQYAARLEAARIDGANQLAAFLMALHGYARNHPGIAIVLSLASTTDAFSKQTQRLAALISQVRGEEISEDEALGIAETAVRGVASVVARDAVQVIPVHATEISSVLAKRIFVSIDKTIAAETAEKYAEMYERNGSALPDEATNRNYEARLIANYPFHPTLVDFLNHKLASAENFQGTRGVLRVLALAVRSIWKSQVSIPMIHACHLDMREERVVNEILGRTGSSDLLFVLNADIGGVDTTALAGGQSNAQILDADRPHPEGHPLYEYTWKTVFLHSLVGRESGIDARIFGLTEAEALLNVSYPGLTPPQARTALEEIERNAFYLRHEQGKYFASSEPTINSVLARIRRAVTGREVDQLLQATARKIIKGSPGMFHIAYDVELPEDIPDNKGRPVLGIVSPTAEAIEMEEMIMTNGPNVPRVEQNAVFLLVPDMVAVHAWGQPASLAIEDDSTPVTRQRLEDLARQVRAFRVLVDNPQNYGINPRLLNDEEFKRRHSERELALITRVSSAYTSLYYPSTTGQIARKEIRTAGGEGGVPFIQTIKEMLLDEGELLTASSNTQADLINLKGLIFEHRDTISLNQLRENFRCLRHWPVLEHASILEQIIRAGVQKGAWYVYRMGASDSLIPTELYHAENEIPMGVNLSEEGYALITPQGARQRGWAESKTVDPEEVKKTVLYEVGKTGIATVQTVTEAVTNEYGEISPKDFDDVIVDLVRTKRLYTYRGQQEPGEKPDLIYGTEAILHTPHSEDMLVTPAEAATQGWIMPRKQALTLDGNEGADQFLQMLHRIGSIYNRGATSIIDNLDIFGLNLPAGGELRLELNNATPKSMQALGELFEVLSNITEAGEQTTVFLNIPEPDDDCLFVKELRKSSVRHNDE